MVLHPEGRAVWNSSTSKWEYEYDVKDHLGNTRASFAINDKVKVLQTRDYYPFGLEQANWYVNDANATKFRYNGKELQDEEVAGSSLGWYDYGARFYDPKLGRWHVVDPLTEWHFKNSPYQYVYNNPLRYIDPLGLDTLDVINIYAPRLDDNQQNGMNIFHFLSEMLRSLDNGGNHNPKKVRDDNWFDRWLLRNFDQNKLRELGGVFGAFEAEPTLNNTVRTSESFRETSDKEIIEEHGGSQMQKTDAQVVAGKYSTWKKTKSKVGSRYEDATGDSVLLINHKGDSTLYIDITEQEGPGFEWRVKSPLK